MLAVLVLLAAVGTLFLFWPRRPPGGPPGPTPILFFGTVDFIGVRSRKEAFDKLVGLPQRFGDVVGFFVGGTYNVCLQGLELMKRVLREEAANGRWAAYPQLLLTHGKRRGVLFAEGHRWLNNSKFLRDSIMHMLHHTGELRHFIMKEADVMADLIRRRRAPQNIKTLFRKHYIRVIWVMLSGRQLSLEEAARIHELQQAKMTAFINKLIYFPLTRFLFPKWSGLTNVLKFRDSVRERLRKDLTDGEPQGTFVSRFGQDKEDSWRPENDEDLYAFLMDMITAGLEPTVAFCEWLLFFLIRYPDHQERIRREVTSAIGTNKKVYFQDRERTPFTRAFLAEVLRKISIAPHSPQHRVTKEFNIGEYRIPCDAALRYDIQDVHMDHKLWEDPDQFNPHRFLKDGVFCSSDNMIAFGVGPRRCTGEHFAEAFSFFLLTNLLKEFSIGMPEGDPPPSDDFDMILTRECLPFKVHFEPI